MIEREFKISKWSEIYQDTFNDHSNLYRDALLSYNWLTRLQDSCHMSSYHASQGSAQNYGLRSKFRNFNHFSNPRYSRLGDLNLHGLNEAAIKEKMRSQIFPETQANTQENAQNKTSNAAEEIYQCLENYARDLTESPKKKYNQRAKLYKLNEHADIRTTTSRVLELFINSTIKAYILLRGFLLEAVTIRGLDDDEMVQYSEHDKQPFIGENFNKKSKSQVYREISDNACAALLHWTTMKQNYMGINAMANSRETSHNNMISLKLFVLWLNSYRNLFTEKGKCRYCDRIFNDEGQVPTWREYNLHNPSAYHMACRPVQWQYWS